MDESRKAHSHAGAGLWQPLRELNSPEHVITLSVFLTLSFCLQDKPTVNPWSP